MDSSALTPPFRRQLLLRPRAVNLALVALLAVAVATGFILLGQSTPEASPQTARVERGTVLATVSASGNVVDPGQVNVDFESAGKVTSIPVEVGERVKPGQVLARLDPTDAKESVRSARAALHEAQADLGQVVQGLSGNEQAAASATAAQAADDVRSKRRALAKTRRLSTITVHQLRRDVTTAHDELATERDLLRSAQSTERSACSSEGTTADCTSARQAVDEAKRSVSDSERGVSDASQAVRSGTAEEDQAVEAAKATLESARQAYKVTIADNRVEAQPARDSERASARARVESARVGVATARRELRETVLRAPVAGTVASVDGAKGEFTGSGSGGSGGSDSEDSSASTSDTDSSSETSGFVVLTDVGTREVEASFSEADAAHLTVGDSATVTFEALGDRQVKGRLTSLAPSSTLDENVVTYTAVISLLDPPAKIRVGQTASAEVLVGEARNVLTVPNAAVETSGETSSVTTLTGSREQTQTVEVGIEGAATTEILSGVDEGETVVLSSGAPSGESGFPAGGPPGGLGGIGG